MGIRDIFNNREIAIGIWLIIFLIWAIVKVRPFNEFSKVVSLFFNKKIIVPYIVAVSYSILGISLLAYLNLWEARQLKDTILWFAVTMTATFFSINKAREDKSYFKDAVKANFKFSVITEFIIGLYSFSLLTELIITPIIVFIGLMQAYSQNDSKYIQVQKLLNFILMIIGFFVLYHTVKEIIFHIRDFASYKTLQDFILSPFLALWFVPFLFLISLYSRYEIGFINLDRSIKDKKLLSFAKIQSALRFNVNIEGFNRWKNKLFIDSVKSKKEILSSIREIKRLQNVEKNPPNVDSSLGWSPYQAKDFLKDLNVNTRYYQNTHDKEWSSSSDYIKLDDELLGNKLSYYITGNETIALKLELVLNVACPEKSNDSTLTFINYCKTLFHNACNEDIPLDFQTGILKHKNQNKSIGNITLVTKKEDWINKGQFSYWFSIHI